MADFAMLLAAQAELTSRPSSTIPDNRDDGMFATFDADFGDASDGDDGEDDDEDDDDDDETGPTQSPAVSGSFGACCAVHRMY
jgi:hypothetical protein